MRIEKAEKAKVDPTEHLKRRNYKLTKEDREKGIHSPKRKPPCTPEEAARRDLSAKRKLAGKSAARAQQQRGIRVGQPIDVPDNAVVVIAALGELKIATHAHASRALGVSAEVFGRWLKTNPQIQEAWTAAKQQEHDALVDKLVRMALGKLEEGEEPGNIVALLFSLKARHGYRDQGDASRVGTMNNTQIVINMPGAKSREDYTRMLAAAPSTDAETFG